LGTVIKEMPEVRGVGLPEKKNPTLAGGNLCGGISG